MPERASRTISRDHHSPMVSSERATGHRLALLLVALASFITTPNATLAAAAQHHDQVPGFYRLKVGDLEVTALFDGPGVFDVNWLNGQKTKDDVVKALQDDPHLMDVSDAGYLVNTGKHLILVEAG